MGWVLRKFKLDALQQHHAPTAWEGLFSGLSESRWILVTLKNEEAVYGLLDASSHVSADPHERDIYISGVYRKAGSEAWEPVPNTEGMYIKAEEISTIELFRCAEALGGHP